MRDCPYARMSGHLGKLSVFSASGIIYFSLSVWKRHPQELWMEELDVLG